MNIKLFPTLNRGFTTVDSTLLAVCITAGAAVIAAIITAVVKITPSYTLRKDRRERIGRYRAEYDNWMRNVKSAQKKYQAGDNFDDSEIEFPKSIDYKNSGISIDAIENGALILQGILEPLGRGRWASYVMNVYEDKESPLEVINGFVNGQLDVTKDCLLQEDDHDFLLSNFWYPIYFEDEVKGFIENSHGATEFSMKISREINAYVSQAREKYVTGKVDDKILHRLEALIRYKLLLESQYILWFFADNVTNYDPKESTLVEKFFRGQDGVAGSFVEYIDSEYDKAEAVFLKKGKM
ncbi:hypothetical protein HMPREF1478_01276 [Actinomyces sp. HPA0247]|nr:hypothetical protein HMPREF1478_01276 [Actinomyces sp. HPA0247]